MHRHASLCTVLGACLALASVAVGAVRTVPGPDYPTIMSAVAASTSGDTVLVLPGEYRGVGNRDIDFGGRNLLLRGVGGADSTLIDCEFAGNGLIFRSGESSACVVEGLTVVHGRASTVLGGGLAVRNAHPTVRSCRFVDDAGVSGAVVVLYGGLDLWDCVIEGDGAVTAFGAGLQVLDGSARATRCTIRGHGGGWGGGIYVSRGGLELVDCVITGNRAWRGGGVAIMDSDDFEQSFRGCTIAGNYAEDTGGGLWFSYCDAVVDRCILQGNGSGLGGSDAWLQGSGDLSYRIDFTCSAFDPSGVVVGGYGYDVRLNGPQVTAAPLFCAPSHWSRAPTTEGVYSLAAGSPCLPEQSPCGALIGALGEGCDAGTVEDPGGNRDEAALASIQVRPSILPGGTCTILAPAPESGRQAGLVVTDTNGRLITRLFGIPESHGRVRASWDGRDAHGHRAPTGWYWIRSTAGEVRPGRVLWIH